MSFLHEKQSRQYFVSLILFSIALLGFGVYGTWLHGRETQNVLLEQERVFVSALLEQGVPVETVAVMLKSDTVSKAGDVFMQQVGHIKQTPFWLLPAIDRTTLFFGKVFLAAAVLFGIIILFLAIRFLYMRERQYKEATDTIMKFAEGDFREHLPHNGAGALFQLFASIDQLATALHAKNEVKSHAKEFMRDMISDISHQIKTPLAALAMYTEIIMEEPDNVAVVKEFSQKDMEALERIEQLIQALLKVTRLDAGSIVFDKKPYPVSEVVARATQPLITRAQAEGKQLAIKVGSAENVSCDLEWTGEAIGNLVKNALDHTMSGDIVCIEYECSPAMVRLSVTDNGCGIAEEELYHIFKRFYRSKSSSDRKGIGLGLPLAKAIIEGQGGLISVQSTYGVGTTFVVSFDK